MRTIAHISDIHFGRIDRAIAEAVVADIAQQHPSLVIISGDLTQRARAGQYREAAAFLARLPRPQLVVPGNHDIPLFDVFSRFFAPLRNYRKIITDDLFPVYRDDELLVMGINTARPFTFSLNGFWKDGRISERQVEAIKRLASDAAEGAIKIVVTHHPFIPPPDEHRKTIIHGANAALEQMAECGIDLCLAGHLHTGYSGDVRTYHEGVSRAIISVQAGTATSTRRRRDPNGYNLVTTDRDRVRIQIRAWNGQRFDNAARTGFARRGGEWVRDD